LVWYKKRLVQKSLLFLAILARNFDEERYSVAFGVVLVVRGNSGN